jgi:multicomponent Na+:H+ antiporter subunit E
VRFLSLAAGLFLFWLALSGHYTPFLIAVGAICSLACAYVAARVKFTDADGHPIHLLPRTLIYYPWLIVEILKSAWGVTKIVLNPRQPISPTMTKVKASQRTPAGIATYGNSITLTPGTLTVGILGQDIQVHALTEEGAIAVESGDMDRHVSRFEGQP